jgi:hypothetical protein
MQLAIFLFIFTLSIFGSSNGFAAILEWPVNGHFYEKVEEELSWTDARTAASSKNFLGVSGHLVTITSAEENQFLVENFVTFRSWIGAFQYDKLDEPAGHWRWVTDEVWDYTNWFTPNEPNESGGFEDWAVFVGSDRSDGSNEGEWNDWKLFGDFSPHRVAPLGYFVEYEPLLTPELPTMLLFLIGILTFYATQKKLNGNSSDADMSNI